MCDKPILCNFRNCHELLPVIVRGIIILMRRRSPIMIQVEGLVSRLELGSDSCLTNTQSPSLANHRLRPPNPIAAKHAGCSHVICLQSHELNETLIICLPPQGHVKSSIWCASRLFFNINRICFYIACQLEMCPTTWAKTSSSMSSNQLDKS